MSEKMRGGASLFVVIFTTLVLTIISVGFAQLMLRNQNETQTNDLSQRAYNSALAGVEDAKRSLLAMQKACASGAPNCNSIKAAIKSQACSTTDQVLKGTDGSGYTETQVGASAENQAYTCVKIDTDTPNYVGSVSDGNATVVPINGVSSFNTVTVSWFTLTDSGQNVDTPSLYTPANPGKLELPVAGENGGWSSENPPIMRVQYIPAGDDVSNLDDDARTLFLYPFALLQNPSPTTASFNPTDQRRKQKDSILIPITCNDSYASATNGICLAQLTLPSTISKGYLQLTPLYNGTHFAVALSEGGTGVDFDNVEPSVDSTGRASDLFRRVVARVKLGGVALPYPQGSLNTVGDLCKDFTLKDSYTSYDAGDSTCNAPTP